MQFSADFGGGSATLSTLPVIPYQGRARTFEPSAEPRSGECALRKEHETEYERFTGFEGFSGLSVLHDIFRTMNVFAETGLPYEAAMRSDAETGRRCAGLQNESESDTAERKRRIGVPAQRRNNYTISGLKNQ